MKEFIDCIASDLAHDEFAKRNAANVALLAYDMGRAKNESERDNARNEWEFRMWAFECQYGLKEAMEQMRKTKRETKRMINA